MTTHSSKSSSSSSPRMASSSKPVILPKNPPPLSSSSSSPSSPSSPSSSAPVVTYKKKINKWLKPCIGAFVIEFSFVHNLDHINTFLFLVFFSFNISGIEHSREQSKRGARFLIIRFLWNQHFSEIEKNSHLWTNKFDIHWYDFFFNNLEFVWFWFFKKDLRKYENSEIYQTNLKFIFVKINCLIILGVDIF